MNIYVGSYWTDCILQLWSLIPRTRVNLCHTAQLSMLYPCTHHFSPPKTLGYRAIHARTFKQVGHMQAAFCSKRLYTSSMPASIHRVVYLHKCVVHCSGIDDTMTDWSQAGHSLKVRESRYRSQNVSPVVHSSSVVQFSAWLLMALLLALSQLN